MNTFRPIHRLAVVNRGEAAMRCIRAVKALRTEERSDLQAVAFYTESDRDAPFVRHADAAFALTSARGEVAAYLDHDGLVAALRQAEADAVWPGWGFVSEDPALVERLDAEGIAFLGPRPDAMRALGDKIEAKRLADATGVPVIPWSGSAVADVAEAELAARRLGYPLVVKAAAGGGGRGIRMVESPSELAEAFRAARAEARAAFGEDRVFLERRIAAGRHVEVQIAADQDGIVLALGCRDCSLQRRHQKVIEEAPPPGLAPARQRELREAAVRIAERVGYSGVGTVEFLVAGDEFHFLEMNPRLQVEHGVTEALTGLDLVQLQIRIARGETLADLRVEERGWALEARVCAEDPDRGFLPSPGRIARFDPVLGPGIRIDTGVTSGSVVPAAFDSLVAKVIASGRNREEARSRLAAALTDFDLVIEGGASNKGYLCEILDHPDVRAGGVDTLWLDRTSAARSPSREFAGPALVAAAILSYQRARALARLNFFANPDPGPGRVPASRGQEIDLDHAGQRYRLRVFAMGSWRYRVHLDEQVVAATLREEGSHTARLQIGERTLRVLYDVSESGLRLEVEGQAHRFSSQQAGHVRASAPAMVVCIDVAPGERVRAGQRLGLLEAMKMELGFEAPVAGTVSEVRACKGEQVGAGDVLLVIDPAAQATPTGSTADRIDLEELPDPLQLLSSADARPDLSLADSAGVQARRRATEAVGEEVRRVLLGYDANPERARVLAEFLEAPLPEGLSDGFLWELARVRSELVRLADVTRLFIRSPAASVSGAPGPSNSARLRMYLRRIRAGGGGIAEEFLDLLRLALAHYGIRSLEPGDALERAVLRLLASQLSPELRDRLALAIIRRVTGLARAGVHLGDDRDLAGALDGLAGARGLLSDAVADAAIEARYVIFEQPDIERQAEQSSKQVQVWLDAAQSDPTAPPEDVLRMLSAAPASIFERLGSWLADPDPRRRSIALAAHLKRLYFPAPLQGHASLRVGDRWIERAELAGGRVVLGGAATCDEIEAVAGALVDAAESLRESHEWPAVGAIELFVSVADSTVASDEVLGTVTRLLAEGLPSARFTVSLVHAGATSSHHTFVPSPGGFREDASLHGLHPEAARRIDLERLKDFDLERMPAGADLYCFHARSRELPGDERLIVLADLRSHSPDGSQDAALHIPAFERAFHGATRTLRNVLAVRDPKRRLQWNRIGVFVAPEVLLAPEVAEELASRLAPATRNLGLEKVLVRLRLLDPGLPDSVSDTEIVIADITGANMTIHWRKPRQAPLSPRSEYERRVADARRRRLVYPYEIVRMLTGSGGAAGVEGALPIGSFEEYDLDPSAEVPTARSVAGRPYGQNQAGVVFGVVSTPTAKVPEGMRRVLVLSDPTQGMGALAGPECDRIVAALDLAEALGLPVEWVPVSSGAKIAMDSGTENLDATARVVRRIVEFTDAGGDIHLIVTGVNVGAQSYFDSLATMLMHTRGALVMTPGAAIVLTGRAALEASGAVSAEDEQGIGGFERIMGPNGEAQYFAADLADAYRLLYEHYRYTYVVAGEAGPRAHETRDPADRPVEGLAAAELEGSGFASVDEIFDDELNPGRKRPFPMRAVMQAVVDADGGHLERWQGMVGAETAIVWDAHLGGFPVCLIGIESQSVNREGYRPYDGPDTWSGGTLFPLSSKKVARALRAASGNRPAVILANLSGFDGSPESMRKLQLEYGAEIARAVVNFDGPILFLVVSRYHGGAYVVFSRELNPRLRPAALAGSYASVIGGGAAAAVVFGREVRARAAADPRLREVGSQRAGEDPEQGRRVAEIRLEKQAELAEEFDAIHTVERARRVGSLEQIVAPERMWAYLIGLLREELAGRSPSSSLF